MNPKPLVIEWDEICYILFFTFESIDLFLPYSDLEVYTSRPWTKLTQFDKNIKEINFDRRIENLKR